MSFKKKDNQILFRTFNIRFPKQLISIYDFLQLELNNILNNKEYYEKLNRLNIEDEEGKIRAKGKIWTDIEGILFKSIYKEVEFYSKKENKLKKEIRRQNNYNFTENWNLGSNSWYLRIVIENIRRSLVSLQEKRKIYQVLQRNGNKICKQTREDLNSLNLYPSNKELKNLISYGKSPDLSKNIRFELDYSISDKTMFKKLGDNKFSIRISPKEWIDIEIELPLSLRLELTGEFANPNFIKRTRDNKYIGLCSYEVRKQDLNLGNNILGIDLGFIRLFSGIVLREDNTLSENYTNSKQLQDTYSKIKRIHESRTRLINKIKHSGSKDFHKNMNRAIELNNINLKIKNIKNTLMEELAAETIALAIQENCSIIKVEDLGVMSNITGKWNYGVYHKKLSELGELYNISIYKVNPKDTSKRHPITKEIGRIVGRDIVFSNGERFDRDYIASINIALMSIKKLEEKRIRTIQQEATLNKVAKEKSNRKKKLARTDLRTKESSLG